jgi:hypothetical protein
MLRPGRGLLRGWAVLSAVGRLHRVDRYRHLPVTAELLLDPAEIDSTAGGGSAITPSIQILSQIN